MRKKLIAANWKMYKTPQQARDFVSAFLPLSWGHTRDEIVLCPAFVDIPAVVEAVQDSGIGVGGQDIFWEKEGAYTSAISAGMLKAAGCTHVIIGHSERRQYFGETDDTVNRKLRTALAKKREDKKNNEKKEYVKRKNYKRKKINFHDNFNKVLIFKIGEN